MVRELEVWEEKDIVKHVLAAQARSLESETKITLSKQQKQQMLGIGNLSMVDNGTQRLLELKKV